MRGGCLRRNHPPQLGPDPEPGLLNDGLEKRVDIWAWRRAEVAGHVDIGADGQDGTVSVIRADMRWLEPFEWLLMGLWLCVCGCAASVSNMLARRLMMSIWMLRRTRVVEEVEEKNVETRFSLRGGMVSSIS